MIGPLRRWLLSLAVCGACAVCAGIWVATVSAAEAPTVATVALPDAAQWRAHVGHLARFWLHEDARGLPVGNFPTWRCNTGDLYRGDPCSGMTEISAATRALLGRDYVRMQSRQTFAYGVLFQLTGDREALALHEAGVTHLKNVARDPAGGFYTWFERGQGRPAQPGRTAQDLAYALLGIAFHAYLTHDPDSLRLVAEGQRYIYDQYWDAERGELRWTLDASDGEDPALRSLVAQLDQLNAYLLLSWRLWPDHAARARWGKVIRQTTDSLMQHYHDAEALRLWGTVGRDDSREARARHNDFGHSSKGYWMLWLAACGLGDAQLATTARTALASTLERAWQPIAAQDLPVWLQDSTVAPEQLVANWAGAEHLPTATWWIWAELDQSALTLALDGDARQLPRMRASLDRWLGSMTDTVWGELKAVTKQYAWRNGYHSLEHALIGWLLSNSLRGETTTLWFAPVERALAVPFTPYLYSAAEVRRDVMLRTDGPPLLAIHFAPAQLPTDAAHAKR